MSRRQFLALILPLLLLMLGFAAVMIVERVGAVGTPTWDESFARHVRSTLAYEFVGGTGDERREWQAYFNSLNAWVRTFDGYAEIVPPWEVALAREESSGQYVGIGIRIEPPRLGTSPAGVEIIGVKPEGPAAKAGIVVGDRIVAVEGRSVSEISTDGRIEGLSDAIRGPRGRAVQIELEDASGARRTVKVVRDAVDTGSIFGVRFVDEERRIGYVRIHGFLLDTAREFRKAVESLRGEGMRALVLDLRENNGGLLPQAVEVADAFLAEGIILRVSGRDSEFSETYMATAEGTLDAALPLAVLINQDTASASEVLAGALRDHRRAVIVGEHSYGKFQVQTVEELTMELGTVLFKRTTSIYETPLGLSYQRVSPRDRNDPLAGMSPDLLCPITLEEWEQLREIFDHQYYADWNPAREPVHPGFVDRQLEAAIALLRGETYAPRLLDE